MGRNKTTSCQKCGKQVRSDNLKRHSKSCLTKKQKDVKVSKYCDLCSKDIPARNWARHVIAHGDANKVIEDIKDGQKVLENKIAVGKVVKEAVRNKIVDPRSLASEYLEAMSTERHMDMTPTTLKLWQEKLLKELKPTDRQIIWVVGERGAEGKSFFQQYLVKTIGSFKVFHTRMDTRPEAILHALSKRQIELIDIFIFNVPRSFVIEDTPYNLLEDIKDGYSLSTKYNSKKLKFNTPNIVLVFSNYRPSLNKMSRDRWNIFTIRDDDLKSEYTPLSPISERPMKQRWKKVNQDDREDSYI